MTTAGSSFAAVDLSMIAPVESHAAARSSIVWAESPEQRARWDHLLMSHPAGAPNLLSWYLDHQRLPRTDVEIVYAERHHRAAAGAVLYTFRLPAPGRPSVCLVPSAPLHEPGQEGLTPEVLAALHERAERNRALILQFEAFEPHMRDLIRDHFARRRMTDYALWRLYHPTLWREYRVDLRGKTPQSLLDSFTSAARRRINQAIKLGAQVIEVRDDAGIDEAHRLWTMGGDRTEYTIRPLESFRSLVRATWAHDAGVLLLSRVDGRIAAFVHALFYRSGAMFMSSAHDPAASRGYGNIVLHYRAMCMALERGAPYYGLGGPGVGGIREFKQGFRPYLIDNMRFVSIMLRPVRASLVRPIIGQTSFIRRAKQWAARSMRA